MKQKTTEAGIAQNPMLCDVDIKAARLLELTDEFIFPAYYAHTNKTMWKIANVYTKYNACTLVLCGVDEGISKALDLAVDAIAKARKEFYGE